MKQGSLTLNCFLNHSLHHHGCSTNYTIPASKSMATNNNTNNSSPPTCGALALPNPSSSPPTSHMPSPTFGSVSTTATPRLEPLSPDLALSPNPIPSAASRAATPALNHVHIRIHPQNTHPIQTRAKNSIVLPRLHPTLLLTHLEPTTVQQALAAPQWLAIMKTEYAALIQNNIWSLVAPPPNCKPIGCKWAFRLKENPDGSINKYKAHLVAKKFHQQAGSDFTETFSPVVKPVTVCTVLTIAISNKWFIQQIDVNFKMVY